MNVKEVYSKLSHMSCCLFKRTDVHPSGFFTVQIKLKIKSRIELYIEECTLLES